MKLITEQYKTGVDDQLYYTNCSTQSVFKPLKLYYNCIAPFNSEIEFID